MKRVTSFLLAMVIFGSTVAGAIFVIQAIKDEQDQSTAYDATASTPEDNEQNNQTEQQPVNENTLQGKPLANFTPTSERTSEVKTDDLTVGTGAEITSASQTVTAHYTGARVVDGIVFESSKDSGNTFTAPLSNLIQGWQTGMIGMKVGGVRRLTIPAAQAYGDDASSGRPTGDLVFDIELFDVK